MYQEFFGLSGKPFQLSPDASFFYASREHKRALAFLEYGLAQADGFIVVTGDVGTAEIRVAVDGIAADFAAAAESDPGFPLEHQGERKFQGAASRGQGQGGLLTFNRKGAFVEDTGVLRAEAGEGAKLPVSLGQG